MKKTGWIILMLTALLAKTTAQQANPFSITGIVRDSVTNKPVAYATVSLFDTAKNNIGAAYTLESGSFKLALAKAGTYKLEISIVGYKTKLLNGIVVREANKDIGTLLLVPGHDDLQEVSVIGYKRLIDQKPGMLVYNSENDITNKGGTAADVLRKAPVLSVDAQGNVSMRGSSNIKILINGKYSGQMARNAADALNMMPANMIKSVEVITTPSAKYDAEGAAGVINIITKKGKGDVNGTLEVSASNLEQMFNPRISFSNDKWNINFAGHMHRLQRKSEEIVDRYSFSNNTATSRLQQTIEKDNIAPHGSADLGITYTIDKTSELSLGINSWLGYWPENTQTTTIVTNPGGSIIQQYKQPISNSSHFIGTDINLAYNKEFSKPGQQFTLQVQNSPSRDVSKYDALQQSMSNALLYRETNYSKTNNREWTFQADYVHPLDAKGKIHLESGAKLVLRNVGNRYDVEASDSTDVNILLPQTDRSDYFTYKQDVVAGYSMLRLNLANNWYIQGGARVEATYIKGNFQYNGSPFSNNFLNIVPTVTISKKLDDQNTITISYTKRLTRPYIWDLNPNIDASDPKNIESGNPNLQPEIAHQAEIAYGLNTGSAFFMNAAIFWKQTNNAIVDFMRTDADGVSYTSKQNLAANKQYGLNLSATANISAAWAMNGNINVNYNNYNSSALSIFHSGWGTGININSTYKLPHHFSVQAFGEYNTTQVTLLGKLGSLYHYSIAGKKEIKKARMFVTLSAVNFFNNYVAQTDEKRQPTFVSFVDNRFYNRALKLTVSWEFGGTRNQQKQRKKIDNNDINQQGKG
ncbi:MAG: TonB-dependent receptor [Chitinophagaceae bacterium]